MIYICLNDDIPSVLPIISNRIDFLSEIGLNICKLFTYFEFSSVQKDIKEVCSKLALVEVVELRISPINHYISCCFYGKDAVKELNIIK